MDSQTLLSTLLELASAVGIDVRPMPSYMDSTSGGTLVKLKGKDVFFLNDAAALGDQTATLAAVLKGRPQLNDRFLPPEVRDVIEKSA